MSTGKFTKRGTSVPDGLQVTRGTVGGREVVVFAYAPPVERGDEPRHATLTAAERDVVRLLLAGYSNAQVADARGTTLRTVSNQIDSAYRRLGVNSRAELAALLG